MGDGRKHVASLHFLSCASFIRAVDFDFLFVDMRKIKQGSRFGSRAGVEFVCYCSLSVYGMICQSVVLSVFVS